MKAPTTKHSGTAALPDITEGVQLAIDTITTHEDSFAKTTLPARLSIGLLCIQAHEIFAAADPAKRGQGKRPNQLTREEITVLNPKSNKPPTSFKEWLTRDIPRLKEPVAYKYMKAAIGLGMIQPSPDLEAIAESIAAWEASYGRTATLGELIATSTLRLETKPDPALQQSEFDFFKENASNCRIEVENIIGLKDRMPEEFRRVLSAQFYTALWELTGTHWQPCDEPPPIAHIDPATIQI